MKLSDLIKQEQFESPDQEALLNVLVTSSWILTALAATMAPYGVTPAQYNVLRILRGSHPQRLTCSALGQRLLDRTPDVTRLLNRLERHGLIHRVEDQARAIQEPRPGDAAQRPGDEFLDPQRVGCDDGALRDHAGSVQRPSHPSGKPPPAPMDFIIQVAGPQHLCYAEAICKLIEEAAKARGIGIAKRRAWPGDISAVRGRTPAA